MNNEAEVSEHVKGKKLQFVVQLWFRLLIKKYRENDKKYLFDLRICCALLVMDEET